MSVRLGLGRALLAGAVLLPATAPAQVAPPRIWAVPGLYGLERSVCGRDAGLGQDSGRDSAMVAPALCDELDSPHRIAIGKRFAAAMAARFNDVDATFAAALPADATPRARLASTLVASLRLTRATVWRVDKPVGTDAFLPITLSLDIVNGSTGEVVFTRTRSDIAHGTFAPGAVDAALRAQLGARIDATLRSLVDDAAGAWKPWSQQATIVGQAGDAWVIDRGRTHGLRAGDAIGADGRVTYAGAGYAVVKPTLERYRTGQQLARPMISPASMLAKPSVLTVMAALPDGYAAPYLSEIFEDALGARGGFAPVPVNPGFANLRQMALGEAQAPSTDPRSLPDYIASVSVAALPPAAFASNIPGVTIERHEAHAFVSLVDRSGRIVATFHGVGRISDEISGTIRFSIEQRRDTVVRNALIDAASQMAEFRTKPLALPIVRDGSAMLVRDPGGALPIGAQLTVLRDVGKMGNVGEHVLLPVGQVATAELVAGGVRVTDADVVALSLKSGDVVALDQAGPALLSRRTIEQCTVGDGSRRIDDRGRLAMPLWSVAAEAGFAARYAAPVHLAGLPARLKDFSTSFAGWDGFAPNVQRKPESCFLPVIAVAPAGAGYDLTVGYTLLRGDQKLAGQGMQAVLTPTRLPAGTAAEAVAAMLQHDLAARLLPLAQDAAGKLRPAD